MIPYIFNNKDDNTKINNVIAIKLKLITKVVTVVLTPIKVALN